ncbi:hypothetical protein ISN45_Aa04g029820 [Arabidopsis thaliana x Arabidopsis arenosa]|uniref:Cysteine sulfinate desulfinase/cysteine desulfurase and related enzymes n=1 Tax=Arabidopsis thaliana x Arabidopsis arenosa TaxID=1240361 RepID=A0A8T2ADC9_9BRAS|nr:hypothetical protein ISN45_Aa04g029820 [Arabidopsis thaliana x Arabidopsis arenosa]
MSSSLPLRLLLLPLTTSLISPPPPDSFHAPSPFRSKNPNFNRRLSSSSTSCSSQSQFLSGRFRSSSPCVTMCLPEHTRNQENTEILTDQDDHIECVLESDEDSGLRIPTQAQAIVEGSGSVAVSELKPAADVDYIQELLAIQQQGPRSIGFFGTRNMGFMHQELIEILSYAMVITKNHIYTSGASGTNAAVIRGALRAERPELLTVILPQSLKKQPPESQELLSKVQNVVEKPHNDHLPLLEASRLCNMDIISQVQQVICFAFHDSKLLMETCQEAKNLRKIVTLFYLD